MGEGRKRLTECSGLCIEAQQKDHMYESHCNRLYDADGSRIIGTGIDWPSIHSDLLSGVLRYHHQGGRQVAVVGQELWHFSIGVTVFAEQGD